MSDIKLPKYNLARCHVGYVDEYCYGVRFPDDKSNICVKRINPNNIVKCRGDYTWSLDR
jgi:hypothetical protein